MVFSAKAFMSRFRGEHCDFDKEICLAEFIEKLGKFLSCPFAVTEHRWTIDVGIFLISRLTLATCRIVM